MNMTQNLKQTLQSEDFLMFNAFPTSVLKKVASHRQHFDNFY